jgi:RecA-family ATPase
MLENLARISKPKQRAKANNGASPEPLPSLPFIDIEAWENAPVPPRQWAVQDRIPLRQPTLLTGEGAIGKTIVLLQLSLAHVLARDWLGTLPEPGQVIYLGAEDEPDELHRRSADILVHYGASMCKLKGRLHLLSLAGEDAILGRPERNGSIQPTPLFNRLLEAACDIKPILIGIDTSADVYAGNENDRAQVRQFVGLLRGLAIKSNSSLVLTAHPSLTGINTGSGLSGTTGWHNSVRARIYMKPAETEQGDEPDPELRQLQFLKNNYGPKAEKILLRWKNGVFAPAQISGSLDKMAADANAERAFLAILAKFNAQHREVSPKPSLIYAPNVFAKEPEANGIKVKTFEGAMSRLLNAKKIHLAPEGPPSRKRYRLVVGAPDHPDHGG